MKQKLKYLIPNLIFALVLTLLAVSSMRHKSTTFDEVSHLPSGYSYVALGDFHHNAAHPPLVKLLSGLLVKGANPKIDTANWETEGEWAFGLRFFYEWNNADQLLARGRLASVLLCLVLGFAIFFAASEVYGWKAGCVALTLYLFNPDFLAHGQLVTTDAGAACFFFMAVWFFWRALQYLSPWRILLAGLATGLLLVTKFSGFLIFPIFVMIGGVFVFGKFTVEAHVWGGLKRSYDLRTLYAKAVAVIGLIVATVLVSWAMIWASYGFRYAISEAPVFSAKLDWEQFSRLESMSADLAVVAARMRLVPEAYAYGFSQVVSKMEGRKAFILGDISTKGFWYYFPVTFLVKTPLALIILIVLSVFLLVRSTAGATAGSPSAPAIEWMLLLPPIFYLLNAISSSMNIGHRHILPIYPFLIVFASGVARVFDQPKSRVLRPVIALLIAWNVVSTLLVYPHFLGYFNEIAGGPSKGYRWLVDSNLDWGQDLKGLAAWRRAHPEGELYVSYYGMGDPEFYQLKGKIIANVPQLPLLLNKPNKVSRFTNIPSGSYVAVSATHLQCLYLDNKLLSGIEEFMARLREMKPIDNVGYSILIYRLP